MELLVLSQKNHPWSAPILALVPITNNFRIFRFLLPQITSMKTQNLLIFLKNHIWNFMMVLAEPLELHQVLKTLDKMEAQITGLWEISSFIIIIRFTITRIKEWDLSKQKENLKQVVGTEILKNEKLN